MNKPIEIDGQVRRSRYVAMGALVFDRDRSLLAAQGETTRLEPKVAAVLSILIEQGASPVTRDELLNRIWGDEGSDEALTQAVSRLRRLAGDAALIETIPRVGYQLAVMPETASGLPEGLQAPVRSGPFRNGRASHVYSFAAGATSMAFVALFLLAVFMNREVNIETIETFPDGRVVEVSRTE